MHLEDHEGLNNGHELYPSHHAGQSGPSTQIEHGLVDIPHDSEGQTAPSETLAGDSPRGPSLVHADNPNGLVPSLAPANNPNGFPAVANCPNGSSTTCPNNNSSNNPSQNPLVLVHDPMTILEVSTHSEITKPPYVLPLRQNRGKPPNRYSPEGKIRYSIANYVSTHRLSPKYCALVQQMDIIKIPTKVE